MLAEDWRLIARHNGRPIRSLVRRDGMRAESTRHGVANYHALFGIQPIPAMKQRQHVASEAVHRSEPSLLTPI